VPTWNLSRAPFSKINHLARDPEQGESCGAIKKNGCYRFLIL
jgi:hypothetical protein